MKLFKRGEFAFSESLITKFFSHYSRGRTNFEQKFSFFFPQAYEGTSRGENGNRKGTDHRPFSFMPKFEARD